MAIDGNEETIASIDGNARLLVRLPSGKRLTVPLRPGDSVSLGRHDDNTVKLDETTVSRHHARLIMRPNSICRVEDLHSANGTSLNGARLTEADLQDGDRIRFGAVTAVYQVDESETARQTAAAPSAGETFACHYQLDEVLGETLEYRNFLAEDLTRKRQRVSLRIFHHNIVSAVGGLELLERNFERILRMPAHPHLIKLTDFGRWRGNAFVVAEWTEGFPLLDLLRHRGKLEVPEAINLSRQAAAAADHVRAHGLPPLDLGPRPVIIHFLEKMLPVVWKQTLDLPIESWPAFQLKISPRLFAAREGTVNNPLLSPLGALVYELLGHPPSASGAFRAMRVADLGEQGNATLARGMTSAHEAFGSETAFIDALADAAKVLVPQAAPESVETAAAPPH